jgi:hypothetical protein
MSDFSDLPSGRLWLYAPDYQIVREEFHFRRTPYPWLLKAVRHFTRDWEQVEGRWVERRITARADLGLNALGVPETVEVVVLNDAFAFDIPVDDALLRRYAQ